MQLVSGISSPPPGLSSNDQDDSKNDDTFSSDTGKMQPGTLEDISMVTRDRLQSQNSNSSGYVDQNPADNNSSLSGQQASS